MSSQFPFSHLVANCQTELQMKEFDYTWSITNFTKLYQLITHLDCNRVENQPFNLHMKINDNKLKFYAEKFSNVQAIEDSIKTLCSVSPKIYEQMYYTRNVIKDLSRSLFRCNIYAVTLLHEIEISDIFNNAYRFISSCQDTFTINFKFYLFDDILARTTNRDILVLKELPINMSALSLNDKFNQVVTFIVGDKCLYVNKALLCLKSAVFEAMFNSNLKENIKNEVEINDIKYHILEQFLLFVQFGSVSYLMSCSNVEIICDLLMVADKYDVPDFKLICEYYLKEKITIDNVEKVLNFAQKYNMEDLKKYLRDFLAFHFKEMEESKFRTLIERNSELLTELLPEMIKSRQLSATYKY